jgi:hypothetical protein
MDRVFRMRETAWRFVPSLWPPSTNARSPTGQNPHHHHHHRPHQPYPATLGAVTETTGYDPNPANNAALTPIQHPPR